MAFPKRLEQLIVTDLLRIVDDEHDFGMAGAAGANLFVARIGRVAAGIADRGRIDARQLPEDALRAPEAAHGEDRGLEPFGEGRLEPVAVDEMPLRHAHLLRAARQRVLAARHFEFLSRHERPHDAPPSGIASIWRVWSLAARLCGEAKARSPWHR